MVQQALLTCLYSAYPFTVQASRAPPALESQALGRRDVGSHLARALSGADESLLGIQPSTGAGCPKLTSITGQGAILISSTQVVSKRVQLAQLIWGHSGPGLVQRHSDECRHGPSSLEAV